MQKQVKGFTLIELLIVIGIIAILATVVILTLNPAELLRQSRDTTRFSDLSTVNSAIALYLSDVAAAWIGTSTVCYSSIPFGATTPTPTDTCGGRFPGGTTYASINQTSTRGVGIQGAYGGGAMNGWMPINFTQISTGSPLPNLPVDPVSPNTTRTNAATTTDDFFYAYAAGSNNTYEINTRIESQKFASSSQNDGGNSDTLYEVGTNPGLNL